MDRQYIESTMIASIGFDETACVLEIEFKNGVVWQYYDVPESEWYSFKASDSKGSYFHTNIKDKYSGNRI